MDKITELKKLKGLLDSRVINENEFQSLKDEVLTNNSNDSNNTMELNKEIQGVLTISFSGQWFLIDAKTKLSINGVLHSTHSTKKGFKVDIPINFDKISLKATIAGLKSTVYDISGLNANTNYEFELIYDTLYGKYSDDFKLTEK